MAISPQLVIMPQEPVRDKLLWRVQSAKSIGMTKCSTISGLKTKKFKDLLSTKNVPHVIIHEKERLYEDNLTLKITVNSLNEQMTKLKTKLQAMKNSVKRQEKNENSENFYIHLKKIIKDLNKKLSDKEFENNELKKNLKITKFKEIERELNIYKAECDRLKFFLKGFIDKSDSNSNIFDLEQELYAKQGKITALQKDNSELLKEISRLKEENSQFKDSHPRQSKRSPLRTFETSTNCNKCQELQVNLDQANFELETNEKKFLTQIESEKAKIKELEEEYLDTYKNCEDLKKSVETLTKQLSEARSKTFNAAILTEKPNEIPTKTSKRPPKLFKRIHKIIKEKFMFLTVFLSFLDKNNTGYTYEEDLKKGTAWNGKKLKDSEISQALDLIQCKSLQIPIKLLEEWYEKFTFSDSDSESDNFKQVKKVGTLTKSTQFEQNFNQNVKVSQDLIQDFGFMFEQIKMLMLERNIPRNKVFLHLFKDDFSPDQIVSVKMLKDSFVAFFTEINTEGVVLKFCEFLVENGKDFGKFETVFKEVYRKLNRLLPEWKIIDKYRAHLEIGKTLLKHQSEILELCLLNQETTNNSLPLNIFSDILQGFADITSDSLEHLYLISFQKTKKVKTVNFLKVFEGLEENEEFLLRFKRKYAEIIKIIRIKMKNSLDDLDNFIGFSSEIGIPVNQFTSSLQTLGIKASPDFINELTQGQPKCDLSLFKAILTEDLNESYESEFNFNELN
jgi:hypothetical protein